MEELEEFAFAGCPDVTAPKEGSSCKSCVSHQVGLQFRWKIHQMFHLIISPYERKHCLF